MKLLKIQDNGEVIPNQEWIGLIPEFKNLFRKPSNKLNWKDGETKGKKYLGYIYFMLDFTSPIKDWDFDERRAEALIFTGLTMEEVKQQKVQDAYDKYESIQFLASPRLKTVRAMRRGFRAMEDYFLTVNFKERDKQGREVFTPKQLLDNAKTINQAYAEIEKLEKSVETELQQHTGIRGVAEMGDKEIALSQSTNTTVATTESEWNESNPEADSPTQWADITTILNK